MARSGRSCGRRMTLDGQHRFHSLPSINLTTPTQRRCGAFCGHGGAMGGWARGGGGHRPHPARRGSGRTYGVHHAGRVHDGGSAERQACGFLRPRRGERKRIPVHARGLISYKPPHGPRGTSRCGTTCRTRMGPQPWLCRSMSSSLRRSWADSTGTPAQFRRLRTICGETQQDTHEHQPTAQESGHAQQNGSNPRRKATSCF